MDFRDIARLLKPDEALADGVLDKSDLRSLLEKLSGSNLNRVKSFIETEVDQSDVFAIAKLLGVTRAQFEALIGSLTADDIADYAAILGATPKGLYKFAEERGILEYLEAIHRERPDDRVEFEGTKLDFEDLTVAFRTMEIDDGYAGFDWTNAYVMDTQVYNVNLRSGYVANSGENLVFNTFRAPMSFSNEDNFDFEGFYATAAWRDGLKLTIEGYDDGVLVGSQVEFLRAGLVKQIVLDDVIFDSVDEVVFIPSGGTEVPLLDGSGEYVGLDDFWFG